MNKITFIEKGLIKSIYKKYGFFESKYYIKNMNTIDDKKKRIYFKYLAILLAKQEFRNEVKK